MTKRRPFRIRRIGKWAGMVRVRSVGSMRMPAQNTTRPACTLIELLVINLIFASMACGAKIGHAVISGWLGCLGGCFLGFVAFVAVFLLYGLLYCLAFEGIPQRPLCQNGCCRARHYDLVKLGNDYALKYLCGDHYIRRGMRFVRIEDGREVPYMRWHPFRGWRFEDLTPDEA